MHSVSSYYMIQNCIVHPAVSRKNSSIISFVNIYISGKLNVSLSLLLFVLLLESYIFPNTINYKCFFFVKE